MARKVKTAETIVPKYTSEQRLEAKKAKLDYKATKQKERTKRTSIRGRKNLAREARKAISAYAANRTVQASMTEKNLERSYRSASEVDDAIATYNSVIDGNPSTSGYNGSKSTSEVGGSGSALGG